MVYQTELQISPINLCSHCFETNDHIILSSCSGSLCPFFGSMMIKFDVSSKTRDYAGGGEEDKRGNGTM